MKKRGIRCILILFCFVFLDQWTKAMAVMHLKSQPSFSIVKEILELVYVENTGSAWGILSGMRYIIVIITVLLIGCLIYVMKHIPEKKKYLSGEILLAVLLSGAAGNLIDRIVRGYVIDFIYIRMIDFPVFNLADIYVTCSIAALLLFYRKEIWEWMKNG